MQRPSFAACERQPGTAVGKVMNVLWPPTLSPIRLLIVLASVMLLWAFLGETASAQREPELPPELEQRAHALYRQVMCPTCPGQTIDQSRAPISANMRGIVRERLLAGDTDEQILNRFVEAYGESVLASPPRDGVGLAVWLVPPIAIAFGGLAVFMAIQTLRRPQPAPAVSRNWVAAGAPASSASSDEGLDSYLRLVDQEMQADDEGRHPPSDERS